MIAVAEGTEVQDDAGMRCPGCGERYTKPGDKPFEVVCSKPLGPRQSLWRKRRCLKCGQEFLTSERVIGRP